MTAKEVIRMLEALVKEEGDLDVTIEPDGEPIRTIYYDESDDYPVFMLSTIEP